MLVVVQTGLVSERLGVREIDDEGWRLVRIEDPVRDVICNFNAIDLDRFGAPATMHVLRTHPRLYVNGILIGNPHYQADQLPG